MRFAIHSSRCYGLLYRTIAILAVMLTALLSTRARADVSLPAIISSNMVLQRNIPVPIWGWAQPGEKVTVTLGTQSVAATTDDKGNWTVKLAPLDAGGPFEITIAGANTLKLTNVLVGEVWLCSGQSNMVLPTAAALNAKEETANAKDLPIRFFQVPASSKHDVQKDVNAKWVLCDPNSANNFSAVGFFFGGQLARELKVPVGMINASYNGSGIQGWVPPDGWKMDVRTQSEYTKATAPGTPDADNMWKPSTLHNAMIAPLVPYGLRGMLWYQGESNAGGDRLYKVRFDGMVTSLRKMWGEGDFPVLFVQLPNFLSDSKFWVEFQEIQTQCLTIPNTGMAVTNDIGEPRNLHPRNKQEVARRLWLIAAAKVYGQKYLEYSGPVFDQMKVSGKTAVLSFMHLGGGLVAKGSDDGKTLSGFVIAGDDGKFAPAQAVIDGDTVIVSADGIDKPTAVRYAWDTNPKCNLYNKAGLPAGCFRTDSSGPSVMSPRRAGLIAIDVPYSKQAITVDGNPAEWKDIPAMPLPFMKRATGSTKLCWRAEGLYGLVMAEDDHITVSASTPWTGDCFELFLEKDAAGAGERTDAAAQYVFAPDPKGEPGKAFVMVAYGSESADKLTANWKKTDGGYCLEFFIPAELLKPATMSEGVKLGCNFSLSKAGKPVEQFFSDKNADGGWGVPATWGLVTLAKP